MQKKNDKNKEKAYATQDFDKKDKQIFNNMLVMIIYIISFEYRHYMMVETSNNL